MKPIYISCMSRVQLTLQNQIGVMFSYLKYMFRKSKINALQSIVYFITLDSNMLFFILFEIHVYKIIRIKIKKWKAQFNNFQIPAFDFLKITNVRHFKYIKYTNPMSLWQNVEDSRNISHQNGKL